MDRSPATPPAANSSVLSELDGLLGEARRQHPGLAFDESQFAAALATLRAGCAELVAAEAAQRLLYASDLYLACGCAAGCAVAVAQFDARCLPVARAAVGRIDPRPQFVDEVLQELRVRLLCHGEAGALPRISRYGGRGPLLGWVRTAAVRLALNHLREQRRVAAVPLENELSAEVAVASDPELGFIRQHYREHFRQAFSAALAELSSRERTLLRLHLLDGLTEQQIGAMYRAHRVTVARWLGKARQQLLHQTQRLLSERLALPEGQLESLTGLVPSHLELSLSRLLRSA